MKFLNIIIMLCACLCLFGCTTNDVENATPSVPLSGEEHGRKLLGVKQGDKITLEEKDLSEVVVEAKVAGRLMDGLQEDSLFAYVLADYRYELAGCHDSYLAVEVGDKILVYDLEAACFEDQLFLSDVDGDGIDEIIVQQQVDAFGGVGQFVSRVFRIENGEISEIFNSIKNGAMFDTGFTGEVLENRRLKVKNTFTGYSTVLDISAWYNDDSFDEKGVYQYATQIGCDSFMEFCPKDTDGDGVFEIHCAQYAFLGGHADGIGYVKCVLKFNVQTQAFDVAEAVFTDEL